MPVPAFLRTALPLALGLAVGAVGATMFMESLPGVDGSPEARANKMEAELKKAQGRIAALEASVSPRRTRAGSTFADKARDIAEDVRAGRPVNPDDILRAAQPLIRDFAPLFERLRLIEQKEQIDRMAGEMARKYDLNAEGRERLAKWFEWKMNTEAKRWTELVSTDGVRIEDIIRASRHTRMDEGIETAMAGVLPPEKLERFKADHLAERAQRVEAEADMKVQRLDSIVKLDEAQRERIFGIMARGSKEYDPAMILNGHAGEGGNGPIADRQAAMLSALRPDQRATFEAEQKRRQDQAAQRLEAMGLSLPAGWKMLDDRESW